MCVKPEHQEIVVFTISSKCLYIVLVMDLLAG